MVTAHNYVVNGQAASLSVPPKSFNALTAPPDEVAAAGLPPRPSSSAAAAYTDWVNHWGKITGSSWVQAPAAEIVDNGAPPAATSGNWAGYVDQAFATTSLADWTEPTVGYTRCSTDGLYTWTGMGGWPGAPPSSNIIEQAGTSIGVSGLGMDQGWWENFNGNLPNQHPTAVNIFSSPGQAMESEVFQTQANGNVFEWILYNAYTNTVQSGAFTATAYDLAGAEGIMERPGGYNLVNFNTVTFLAEDTFGQGTSPHSFTSPFIVTMEDGYGVDAQPSGIGIFEGASYWTVHQVTCY